MTFPKARLAVSAVLFFGWLGFLLYLVIDSPAVILSRPQFRLAQLIVVAEIGAGPGPVVIEEVLWPADERVAKHEVKVAGLGDVGPEQGYRGSGKYLLPLVKVAGTYQIVPLPTMAHTPEIRVYPWIPGLRRQVEAIVKARE